MTRGASERIAQTLGLSPVRVSPLYGGCVAEVYLAEFPGGRRMVVKIDRRPRAMLDREGFMLGMLRERSAFPVPEVIACEPGLLAMEYITHEGGPDDAGREQLARLVADLHGIAGPGYGLDRHTLIGPLEQPNQWTDNWAAFYAEQRVRHFARHAHREGQLPAGLLTRCERLADRMGDLLGPGEGACLIHGDLWAGNVLWRGGLVAGIIDPAVYYAEREVELTFMELFGSFGDRFWSAYCEHRPLRDGFFEQRIHAYRVYPLLVHVSLFGDGYIDPLVREIDACGF
ncbi:MAG: fructosamine kinase [Leptolyngbya sp. PLA3]|nr:MAG: fructosamine kinase [Cyanobacteria bacterium CYA]MCE7967993.1 fructosamine kinase [Leptolyngbya sp. PL-A3]